MEMIKVVGIIIIGFIVFLLLITTVWGAVYNVKVVKTGCKLWAQQIYEKFGFVGNIVGGILFNYVCEVWWF